MWAKGAAVGNARRAAPRCPWSRPVHRRRSVHMHQFTAIAERHRPGKEPARLAHARAARPTFGAAVQSNEVHLPLADPTRFGFFGLAADKRFSIDRTKRNPGLASFFFAQRAVIDRLQLRCAHHQAAADIHRLAVGPEGQQRPRRCTGQNQTLGAWTTG